MEILAGRHCAAHRHWRSLLADQSSTLLSLFCHSYQQGRKQAEERRQAIPEVNLRMQFLQQVKEEEKEMKLGKIQPKGEVNQEENEEEATLT